MTAIYHRIAPYQVFQIYLHTLTRSYSNKRDRWADEAEATDREVFVLLSGNGASASCLLEHPGMSQLTRRPETLFPRTLP